jgi:hypothetical protein
MKIITVKIRNHQRSHSSKQVRELIGRQFWKAILLVLLLLDAPITLQAQFGYSNNGDGTCTITHYTGAGGAVAIPTNLNGLTVTGIGEGALGNITGGTSLTSITIPNSVTNIGHGAFANNYDLTSVMLPTNLANIQNSLFVGDALAAR